MKTQKHEILCLAPVMISLIKIIQETLQIIKLGLISVPKDRLEQFRASLHKRILNTVDRHSFFVPSAMQGPSIKENIAGSERCSIC